MQLQIDWSTIGKFKKMGKFTVKSNNQRYESKTFLFDKNILITKVLTINKLEIINILALRDIQCINSDTDYEFVIVTDTKTEIQFENTDTQVIHDWIQLLASESDRGKYRFFA